MKRGVQAHIASKAGISRPFFNEIINGRKRPSWLTAKKLTKAVPKTTPEFWLESGTEEIRATLDTFYPDITEETIK